MSTTQSVKTTSKDARSLRDATVKDIKNSEAKTRQNTSDIRNSFAVMSNTPPKVDAQNHLTIVPDTSGNTASLYIVANNRRFRITGLVEE